MQFLSAGVKIIAVAVGRDIDVNALGKLTKSADDLIIPKTGTALAEAAIATSALAKACSFIEKSKFFIVSFPIRLAVMMIDLVIASRILHPNVYFWHIFSR